MTWLADRSQSKGPVLVRKPEAIEWDEEKAKPTETSVTTEPAVESDSSILTAH